ncbi:MAG: UDP-3-O-(3-hydroxymyristoyl)glucosamine N-acyltransferase [Candidatus Omnitrophica bacterium]|nr:UDP-3-O-(3-hydroxymyristoyl)glucosamine N-acyltransferase [Candidatus Omnitrophota bacterium]
MFRKTLAEIALLVGGRVVGDTSIVITGISGIKEAKGGDLTFLANPKYLPLAADTGASAILVGNDVLIEGKPVIQTDNPSFAFSKVLGLIKEYTTPKLMGIHPSAVVHPEAVLGEGVGLGPHVVVEKDARIGRNTVICAGTYIGTKTVLGDNCLIYPNVTVREEVIIGNNVIIHSGTVVGSDGFGYAQVGDIHVKIPQMGTVVIEDDVEIGACVTIDRARFDKTLIGQGTKIDNLVQIAHNVQIGKNCILIAFAGIAGSATIGDNAIIAGQVGVAGHVSVGSRAVVAAQSGITKDVPAGTMMFGTPAEEYKAATRVLAHMKRLPRYAQELKELREKIQLLEEKLGKSS